IKIESGMRTVDCHHRRVSDEPCAESNLDAPLFTEPCRHVDRVPGRAALRHIDGQPTRPFWGLCKRPETAAVVIYDVDLTAATLDFRALSGKPDHVVAWNHA